VHELDRDPCRQGVEIPVEGPLGMCGIAGFLDVSASSPSEDLVDTVGKMADALAHRGPDDDGTWVDPEVGLAFGHRRLSIVDLSAAGKQPMISRDGRWVLNYNGELYNHGELRTGLLHEGVRFRGSSDTEVLLEAIALIGVEEAIDSLNGMFAAALWDRSERELWLVRDRLGEKPLYWGWFGKTLVFGSELKALRMHPRFRGDIDRAALASFFRTGCVPAPYSIYAGVRKLQPGHLLRISGTGPPNASVASSYWSAHDVAAEGLSSPLPVSDAEATDLLDAQLRKSVAMRMVADVPVGAFLSGGVDSSLVTSLMQAQSPQPVRTFTVGFEDQQFDEAPFAKRVATALGTNHTELYVQPQQAMALVPRLATIYDEPFADSSQIPTYLIAALAREQVKVALSGDGGDELFAGYDRMRFHRRAGRYVQPIPKPLRDVLASRLSAVPPTAWLRLADRLAPSTGGRSRRWITPGRVDKLGRLLQEDGAKSVYLSLVSLWQEPNELVREGQEPATVLNSLADWLPSEDPLNTFLWLDLVSYLPDDLLVKVDRAAMAVSLETRLPLLDHDFVALAWRLPLAMKLRGRHAKWLLKEVLARYVPRELFDRPKQGFSVPLDRWLRGPLREWGEDVLAPAGLRRQGYLNEQLVQSVWSRHQAGEVDASHQLWAVLMFQEWLQSETAAIPA